MAIFNAVGLDALEQELARRASLVDDIAPELLKAGTDVLVEYQRGSILAEGLVDTGALFDSIQAGAVRDGTDGHYQEVWPHGIDSKGESNAKKGFVLNYGTSKIDPTHWMVEANTVAKEDVVEEMRQVWADYTERIDGNG